jgi:hypothetical protein
MIDEVFVNYDILRITSVGDWTSLGYGVIAWAVGVPITVVVGTNKATLTLAVLFLSLFAVFARTATFH